MNNYLTIYDYCGIPTQTEIDLDDLDDILCINIKVISGDEIAEVVHRNGRIEYFDSSCCRTHDFHDGFYEIYNPAENVNFFTVKDGKPYKKWCESTNSYDRIDIFYEEEDEHGSWNS